MRVLQLIDSLEAGGAERMAVSYANSLSKKIAFSGLIATRKEGQLLSQINQNVDYLFLNKKNKFKAFLNNIYIFVNMENYPQNEHKHDRIMHH